MGILKGSVTISRYQVEGRLPPDLADFLDRRIKAHAFGDIEQTIDELAVGWVSAGDFLDASFAYADYSLEPYVVLALRVDRRRVPGPLLAKYHRLELARAEASQDQDQPQRLGRARREQLKDRARLGLLQRIPPESKVYDVVWDTSQGQLWLGASSRPVRQLFEEHFQRAFKLDLIPRLPFLLARDLLGQGPAGQELEQARPWDLSD